MIFGLILVAFFTLLERKVLGFSQIRLGPNKIVISGLLQPLMDGLKLLTKNLHMPLIRQVLLFIGPAVSFGVLMTFWRFVLPWGGRVIFRCSVLLLFMALGFRAYIVVLIGWGITRMFSKLGGLRGMLQGLSFEVSLIIAFLLVLIYLSSINISNSISNSFEIFIVWGGLWIVLCLMERNRAPFDLLEGESELISGFNIEIRRILFVLVFLREYGILFCLGILISIPFFDGLRAVALSCSFILLFIRSCFPRVRYDSLMVLTWQSFLPVLVLFSLQFKFFY